MSPRHEAVRLIATLESTPTPCESLFLATSEPPRSPESVVLNARGWCLAMAIHAGHTDEGPVYRWALTGTGCQVIDREVRGAA